LVDTRPASGVTPNRATRWLVFVLRGTAVVTGLAVFAVVMPRAWMATVHGWLGLGPFPDGPIVEYLARSLSGFYAILGGLLWLIARDLRRYGPVLTYLIVLGFACAVAMPVIDYSAGMPWWWLAGEGSCILALSTAMCLLKRRAAV
jgi:hypothetical protein